MAPADAPYTASKADTTPSSCSARAMPAETVPRIPPPSIASAIRSPSVRCPGRLAARRRSASTRGTPCAARSARACIESLGGGSTLQRTGRGAQFGPDDRRAERGRIEPDLHAAPFRVGHRLVLRQHPETVHRARVAQPVEPQLHVDRADPGDRHVVADRELLDHEERFLETRRGGLEAPAGPGPVRGECALYEQYVAAVVHDPHRVQVIEVDHDWLDHAVHLLLLG